MSRRLPRALGVLAGALLLTVSPGLVAAAMLSPQGSPLPQYGAPFRNGETTTTGTITAFCAYNAYGDLHSGNASMTIGGVTRQYFSNSKMDLQPRVGGYCNSAHSWGAPIHPMRQGLVVQTQGTWDSGSGTCNVANNPLVIEVGPIVYGVYQPYHDDGLYHYDSYSHSTCISTSYQQVNLNSIIGHVSNQGTTFAHLHIESFSCTKRKTTFNAIWGDLTGCKWERPGWLESSSPHGATLTSADAAKLEATTPLVWNTSYSPDRLLPLWWPDNGTGSIRVLTLYQ
jgi:hypothetical protein